MNNKTLDTILGWIIVIAMIGFCFWLTGCKTFKPSRYDEPIGAYHNLTVREFDSLLYEHDKILLRQVQLLMKPDDNGFWIDSPMPAYYDSNPIYIDSTGVHIKTDFQLTY